MKAGIFKPYVICVWTVALLAGNSLYAQYVLTIDEAIAAALKNNHDITLAKYDSTSAAIDNSLKRGAFLPQLNANTGIVFNNNDQRQKFNDGTERERNGVQSNNFNAGIALNWTLFDGLRMFATKNKVEEFVKIDELN